MNDVTFINEAEVLMRLADKFSKEEILKLCEMKIQYFDIKYQLSPTMEDLAGYDYERQWWIETLEKLK